MGAIDDIMKVLDRTAIWRRLQQIPSETDELKARVSALEEKLTGKWPPDVCRFCGERTARFNQATNCVDRYGFLHEFYKCESCLKTDERLRKP
jgi:hypothetical protein